MNVQYNEQIFINLSIKIIRKKHNIFKIVKIMSNIALVISEELKNKHK